MNRYASYNRFSALRRPRFRRPSAPLSRYRRSRRTRFRRPRPQRRVRRTFGRARYRRSRYYRRRTTRPSYRDTVTTHTTKKFLQRMSLNEVFLYTIGGSARANLQVANANGMFQYVFNIRAYNTVVGSFFNTVTFPNVETGETPVTPGGTTTTFFYIPPPTRRFVSMPIRVTYTFETTLRRSTNVVATLTDVVDSNVLTVQDNIQVLILWYMKRDGRTDVSTAGPIGPANSPSSVLSEDQVLSNPDAPFQPTHDGTYRVLRRKRYNFSGLKPYTLRLTIPGGTKRFTYTTGGEPVVDDSTINTIYGIQMYVRFQDPLQVNPNVVREFRLNRMSTTSAFVID